MPKESANRNVVRYSADSLPETTEEDVARLLAAMEGPINTRDLPEARGDLRPVRRDASGRLPTKRPSPIRDAILQELGRREMTRYELWKAARERCATLSQSAVYEWLRGQREIGLPYAEALLEALGLGVNR